MQSQYSVIKHKVVFHCDFMHASAISQETKRFHNVRKKYSFSHGQLHSPYIQFQTYTVTAAARTEHVHSSMHDRRCSTEHVHSSSRPRDRCSCRPRRTVPPRTPQLASMPAPTLAPSSLQWTPATSLGTRVLLPHRPHDSRLLNCWCCCRCSESCDVHATLWPDQ